MKQKAFSLVEVMVAITIIGVIGLFSSTILIRTFRAGSESEDLSKSKQNGDQAINLISETIRNADSIVCYQPNSSVAKAIVVRSLSGQYTKFSFIDPVTSANGYIEKQEPLLATDFNNFCTTTLASPTPVAITNKDTTSGVSISNGYFQRLAGKQGRDIITIIFYVNKSLKPININSKSETVYMETTIQVRGDLR